jgi:hypothetical protein
VTAPCAGEPVTVFVAGHTDAQYVRAGMGIPDTPMAAVRLAGGIFAYVPAAFLVPGDIRPTLRQALLDAKECRRWRRQSPEAGGWIRQYEAALDVLGLTGG